MDAKIALMRAEQHELIDWYGKLESALTAHAIRRGSDLQDRMAIKCALSLRNALIEPEQGRSEVLHG